MSNDTTPKRELWKSKTGLILAMAGNAIGLGNFLRFPVQAAENGGGAFMVPYIISFFLIGIPIMWIEWAMGRYGGSKGHGTTPSIFALLWNHPAAKVIGVLGLWIPLIVAIYYIYIESWTLGYSLHFLLGTSPEIPATTNIDPDAYLKPFGDFLGTYIGAGGDSIFLSPSTMACTAFIITVIINFTILLKGISRGIEIFAKFALPTLFILALILLVRVLTLDTPHGSAIEGLNFLWTPDLQALKNPNVWIAAAGQMFFTLSLGFGAIITYASYIQHNQDITLCGLTSATLNETVEVIIGGSIAIPAAVAFFGITGAIAVAQSGAFSLGFISVPAIFASMPFGNFFGFLWFFLLFFAGLTSSVAITQPIIAFFQDEFSFTRTKSIVISYIIIILSVIMVIFVDKTIDEWDFWAGTIGVVLLGFFELIIFMWIFGGEKAWEEVNKYGLIKAPKIFYYIMRYITPVFLLILITFWGYDFLPRVLEQSSWNIWLSRAYILGLC
nr:sodium:calcium symporter [Candidatus Dadabacteria bacterium]NIT14311.1 sodium:calcium symporter [Candidatus Dadabacteria bacterium]